MSDLTNAAEGGVDVTTDPRSSEGPSSAELFDTRWEELSVDVRAIFQLLASHSSDILLVIDPAGNIVWASPSIENLLGHSPSLLVGQPYAMLLADSSAAPSPWWVEDPSPLGSNVALQTNHHEPVSTRAHLLEISSESSLRGFRTILHTVNSEVASLEELHHYERVFFALLDALEPFIIMADSDSRITWCSPHLAASLHCAVDHVVGRPLAEVVLSAPDANGSTEYVTDIVGGDSRRESFHCREVRARGHGGQITTRVLILELAGAHPPAESRSLREAVSPHSSSILLRLSPTHLIDDVSSSAQRLLGWTPETLVGRGLGSLVAVDSLTPMTSWLTLTEFGSDVPPLDVALQRVDGSLKWFSASARRDAENSAFIIVSLDDATRLVTTQQAWRTVAAAQRAITESENEAELLRAYCQVPVDHGGYAFSWFGRKVLDENQSVDIVAASYQHHHYLDDMEISWSDRPSGMGPSGRAIVTGLPQIRPDVLQDPQFGPWRNRVAQFGFRSSFSIPIHVNGEVYGAWTIYATTIGAFDGSPLESLLIAAEDLGRAIERFHTNQERRQLRRDQLALSTAMAQASEMVIITNIEGRITYVNDAVLRTTGYERDEIIGQFPRLLQSGYQSREFYLTLWHTLTRGHTWRGNFVNRKKNGEHYEVAATLSPTYDDDGNLTGYLGLSHEITLVKQLESLVDMGRLDHSSLTAVMRDVRQESTLELTARAMCQAVLKIRGITEAWFLLFDESDSVIPLGTSRTEMDLEIFQTPEMMNHSREIRRRAGEGPWWRLVAHDNHEMDPQVNSEIKERGVVAFIHLPVRWQDAVVGVLVLGTDKEDAATWLDARLDAFAEVGAFAGSVLGEQASHFQSVHQLRVRIDEILADEAWTPVFQPFTNLLTGEVVGYEALTRFYDGTRPDVRFEEAFIAGRGPELEAACARAALRDAVDLPSNIWISLNFAPETILSGLARQVVLEAGRPIVIEVTEHTIVDNYDALRAALRDVPRVKVAVDDAGSGYTSLQHIVQLRPDYVKMDISLIRDIDHDPIRQAMVAGLCYFAGATGCAIIAEGIERTEEADVLRNLGVTLGQSTLLGQGYLFGRPAPLHPDTLSAPSDFVNPHAGG